MGLAARRLLRSVWIGGSRSLWLTFHHVRLSVGGGRGQGSEEQRSVERMFFKLSGLFNSHFHCSAEGSAAAIVFKGWEAFLKFYGVEEFHGTPNQDLNPEPANVKVNLYPMSGSIRTNILTFWSKMFIIFSQSVWIFSIHLLNYYSDK